MTWTKIAKSKGRSNTLGRWRYIGYGTIPDSQPSFCHHPLVTILWVKGSKDIDPKDGLAIAIAAGSNSLHSPLCQDIDSKDANMLNTPKGRWRLGPPPFGLKHNRIDRIAMSVYMSILL